MTENSLSDVELVLALNGTPLEPETDPAPEVTEPPLDELEQLRLDVLASGDPALLERFEKIMADASALATRAAEQNAELKLLVPGNELKFVVGFPEHALRFYNGLSPEEQAAFSEALAQQYALAAAIPHHSGGDGATFENPLASAPDFPPTEPLVIRHDNPQG